jgi:hypothetical protein
MKRLHLTLAVCAGIAAIAPAAASAAPPQPPPGCNVVVTTPASTTGAPAGQANKSETFQRLCVG